MRVYDHKTFQAFRDRDSGAVLEDIEFRHCYFESCAVSITNDPRLRSTIRNVRLKDCQQLGSALETAILEDVIVDGFKNKGQPLQIRGAAFKHVILRGKIDRLMLSWQVDLMEKEPHVQQAFDEANEAYYRDVDWALDISQGEFRDLDIRGLPGHLIRRDPETQVLITREKALQGRWKDLDYCESLWPFSIDSFLQTENHSLVLVAPKQHRKFKDYVADLHLLREAGVAEPD